eukprot:1195693-Pyramimonas_sp.AAC.1
MKRRVLRPAFKRRPSGGLTTRIARRHARAAPPVPLSRRAFPENGGRWEGGRRARVPAALLCAVGPCPGSG